VPPGAPPLEGAQASELTTDPSTQKPVFGTAAVGAELGSNYIVGTRLALFATPHPGVSLGGSAFFSPFCSGPSTQLWRAMGELRLGTPYADYRRSLAWFGVAGGLTYMSNEGLDPSPVVSIAVGGDIRLTRLAWFELSPTVTWAQMIGPGSHYAGAHLTAGFYFGIRFDFSH
jgi:hypothetical protein